MFLKGLVSLIHLRQRLSLTAIDVKIISVIPIAKQPTRNFNFDVLRTLSEPSVSISKVSTVSAEASLTRKWIFLKSDSCVDIGENFFNLEISQTDANSSSG